MPARSWSTSLPVATTAPALAVGPSARLADRRPLLLLVAAMLTAAALVAALVIGATQAAWTASVASEGNLVGTAEVSLDGAGAAVFTLDNTNLLPGEQVTRTIAVTNDGTRALSVALYTAAPSDDDELMQHLDVKVGTTAGGTDVFHGSMEELVALGDYDDVAASQRLAFAVDHSETYHVRVTLDANAPSSLQGAVAGLDLVWEGRVTD
jgi:hypothetical protein